MTERPQDREAPAREPIESFGGKMHHYNFILGEYDGLAIIEFPDNAAAAATSMRASVSGAFARFETHPLLTTTVAHPNKTYFLADSRRAVRLRSETSSLRSDVPTYAGDVPSCVSDLNAAERPPASASGCDVDTPNSRRVANTTLALTLRGDKHLSFARIRQGHRSKLQGKR